MKRFVQVLPLLIWILFSLLSCNGGGTKKYKVTPNSYGKPNSILLLCDPYYLTSAVGDSFKIRFESLFPVTPQEEPLYDVRYTKFNEFQEAKILKTHRTILMFAALDDKNDQVADLIRQSLGEKKIKRALTDRSYRLALQKDRWASGQMVIYWFAPDRQQLLESISQDYEKVMNVINKEDAAYYLDMIFVPGQNRAASQQIAETLSFDIQIPREYIIAHIDSQAVWLRRETDEISSNLFFYSLPMVDSNRAVIENFTKTRNRLTKTYFSTWVEGSYMRVDNRVLPIVFENMTIQGRNTLQARGLWAMVNDFMGGSFISYVIEDVAKERILFMDGFVHAPGQRKRPELRKLDLIFSTLKL